MVKKPGLKYVRRKDPATYDATQATLTLDAAWHDLDLSSIIPKNAKLVHFRLRVANAATGKHVKLRANGETLEYAIVDGSIIVVNLAHELTAILECNGQAIEYKADAVAWASIGFVVLGWFL
jgi:hypothetical protein